MLVPSHLKDVCIPPRRIAEVSAFPRFTRYIKPIDLVRGVAWHETGHAVSWALKGSKLLQTTIVPDGGEWGVQWGLTEYDVPDELPIEERQRMAFSGMAGAAICELAGTPDIDAIWEDFQESVDELRPVYRDQIELCDRAVEVWIEVLKFFGRPRVWRTAEAFAQRLIADGTVKGFPEDCIRTDNSPIAGLEEALATSIGTPGSREHLDWMDGYCELRLFGRHAE